MEFYDWMTKLASIGISALSWKLLALLENGLFLKECEVHVGPLNNY